MDTPTDYVGGGGQNTLRDQSDTTYIRSHYTYDALPGEHFVSNPACTFEAVPDLPETAVVTSATIYLRCRTDGTDGAHTSWDCAGKVYPEGWFDPYYVGWMTEDPRPTTSTWATLAYTATDFGPSDHWYEFPTAAAIIAGEIQISIGVGVRDQADHWVDFADIWIQLGGVL